MSFRVVGIGELLWDLLPGGRKLGGAPGNFTYHAASLGADAQLISRVGNDNLGREALEELTRLGVPVDCVETDLQLPTGTVGVELSPDGQAHYSIHENVAWDALAGEQAGRLAVGKADAICFGSLAQRDKRARATIQSLVAHSRPSALRIFDVNLRPPFVSPEVIQQSLELANVLKLNETELPYLAKMLALSGDVHSQITALSDRYQLQCIAFTRGSKGSLLFSAGQWSDHPGIATDVVDTIDAGDAFTAALAIGFLLRWSLDEINRRAAEIASFVCANTGATPALPPALRKPFLASISSGEGGRPRVP